MDFCFSFFAFPFLSFFSLRDFMPSRTLPYILEVDGNSQTEAEESQIR